MAYFKIHVAVHLFLMRQQQILLLRRFNTGYEDGNYSVIAGHTIGNESVYKAMQREAREEAGILVHWNSLSPVQVMHRKKPIAEKGEERLDYFFTAYAWDGEIRINEPNKCDDLRWFPIDNLPANMVGYVRSAFMYYQQGIPFTLYGWDESNEYEYY